MCNKAIPISGNWSTDDVKVSEHEILCVSANLADIEPIFLDIAISCLSVEEAAYANSFLKNVDRTRYALSHFLLNQLLIATFGGNSKQVRRNGNKPCLLDNLGEFNISHSDSYFVAAFSFRPVGIDIERIKKWAELKQIEQLVFHPQEALETSLMNQHDALIAFFRCWTRKEALLKLIGIGLNVDMSAYYVSTSPQESMTPSILGVGAQNYTIVDLEITDSSFLGSVAYETSDTSIRFKHLSEESVRSLVSYCNQATWGA